MRAISPFAFKQVFRIHKIVLILEHLKSHLSTKETSTMRLYMTILFIGLIALLACKDEESINPKLIEDYFKVKADWVYFQQADALKWERNHPAAVKELSNILNKNIDLKKETQAYGLNQLSFHYLKLRAGSKALETLKEFESIFPDLKLSDAALGDYYFNRGLYHQLKEQGDSSVFYLKKSIQIYDTIYQKDHLHNINAQAELAYTFRFLTTHVDSLIYYADQAYESLVSHPSLHAHAQKVFFTQAYSYWMRRSHTAGENMCQLAIEAAERYDHFDTLLTAQCHSLKGRFVRKDKRRMAEALGEFEEAVRIGNQIKSNNLKVQELYRDLISSLELLLQKKHCSQRHFSHYAGK